MNKKVKDIKPININIKYLKNLLMFIDEFEHQLWIDNVNLPFQAYELWAEIKGNAQHIKECMYQNTHNWQPSDLHMFINDIDSQDNSNVWENNKHEVKEK